jgi:hypothetical protein
MPATEHHEASFGRVGAIIRSRLVIFTDGGTLGCLLAHHHLRRKMVCDRDDSINTFKRYAVSLCILGEIAPVLSVSAVLLTIEFYIASGGSHLLICPTDHESAAVGTGVQWESLPLVCRHQQRWTPFPTYRPSLLTL